MPPSPKPKLRVHSFPRPPLLERTPRHIEIKWNGMMIVDTKEAYWLLETTHPPTYYLPRSALNPAFKVVADDPDTQTFCEWKGMATYWTLHGRFPPDPINQSVRVRERIWSYENPMPPYQAIKGYLSFFCGGAPWECFVDGEKADGQEGGFYGGWVTSDIVGPFKGGPGTWGW